jgi:hypothetical protein
MWQNGTGSNIHGGLAYDLGDGKVLSLNDLRAIWEYLNCEIPLESTLKEAHSGKRSPYISEREK